MRSRSGRFWRKISKQLGKLLVLGAESDPFRARWDQNISEQKLNEIPKLKIIGTSSNKASVISFVIDGIHPHDLGTLLNQQGIAVRTGHHCTQPLMKRFNTNFTTRVSIAFYNTIEEIDLLINAIKKSITMLA